jgi:hypothetical protein
MKAVRVLLIALGAGLVLGSIALGVAFNSSFQTWAARHALAQRPDLNGTIGAVSAGFRHVELRDLRLESRGVVLTLPKLDAEVPIASAALSQVVTVKSVVAKGWTLDLTHAQAVALQVGRLLDPLYAAAPRASPSF